MLLYIANGVYFLNILQMNYNCDIKLTATHIYLSIHLFIKFR